MKKLATEFTKNTEFLPQRTQRAQRCNFLATEFLATEVNKSTNSYAIKLWSGLIVLLVLLSMFSASTYGWVGGCNPPCGPCKTCQGGVCVNNCLSSQCQTCVNGQCQSWCNSSNCEICDGQGHCISRCDPDTEKCLNGQCVPLWAYIIYTYDGVGNRTSMTDPTGTTSYIYDYLSRLTSVTNPDNKTISYQYDAGGNRTRLTNPAGGITNYSYDGDSRLITVNAPAGATTYQYDSLGNLTRADFPNGTFTQYSYNSQRNWLLYLVNKNSAGTVLSSFSYTYDNVGNRLSVTEADGSAVSYGYDNIYQLTGETRTGTNPYTITYQYDSVGNRTQMIKNGDTTSYTYNNNNQLLTETIGGTTVTYSYDLNGNLLTKTAGGNTTGYTWDWNNHLVAVSEPGGNTFYEYDGDGVRISKMQSGVKTKYINDVALPLVQVLMETDNSGIVQAVYNYGNDLISMNRAGTVSYYHYDGLGSTWQLTADNQTVAASYTYDGFGNVIAQTAGGGMASNPAGGRKSVNETGVVVLACFGLCSGVVSIRKRKYGLIAFLCILLLAGQIPTSRAIGVDVTGNPYGFTGEQQFGEANDLIFLRARYYSPSIGRFISRDPIGYRAGVNLYAYCMNSPIVHVDPDGKLPGWLIAIGVALIIWGVIEAAQCFNALGNCLEEVNRLRPLYPCDTKQRWKEAMRTEACKEALDQCPDAAIGSYGP